MRWVVGHQTIGPDSNAAATAPFGHEVAVVPVVFGTKKMSLVDDCRVALYDVGSREPRFVLCVP